MNRYQVCFNVGFAFLVVVDVEIEGNDLSDIYEEAIFQIIKAGKKDFVCTPYEEFLDNYEIKRENFDTTGALWDKIEEFASGDGWYESTESGERLFVKIEYVIDGGKEEFFEPQKCTWYIDGREKGEK